MTRLLTILTRLLKNHAVDISLCNTSRSRLQVPETDMSSAIAELVSTLTPTEVVLLGAIRIPHSSLSDTSNGYKAAAFDDVLVEIRPHQLSRRHGPHVRLLQFVLGNRRWRRRCALCTHARRHEDDGGAEELLERAVRRLLALIFDVIQRFNPRSIGPPSRRIMPNVWAN